MRLLTVLFSLCLLCCTAPQAAEADQPPIDWPRAQQLFQRVQKGETLSADDQAYLDRAKQLMHQGQGPGRQGNPGNQGAGQQRQQQPAAAGGKESCGLIPLTELGTSLYRSEDGGLYGGGKNEPPPAQQAAGTRESAKITPLDASGAPAKNGKVVLVALSMSNATQEFSAFKRRADAEAQKSGLLEIVDCAQSSCDMSAWATPNGKPWPIADERLATAGAAKAQVQVAWIKVANIALPGTDEAAYNQKLEQDTRQVIQNAKAHFPNLRVVYFSSRTYGGYSTRNNTEPYAYDSAFAVRHVILSQIKGDPALSCESAAGAKAPLLLWGPYLWADGVTARKSDGLKWERGDFGGDGVHPSDTGRHKVADLLLKFFKTDPLAKTWFLKPDAAAGK